ncbi:phosphoglycerate mutase family protein [Paenibacillus elgii]
MYLIRHGEAEHLLKGVVGGWSDTPLTENGRVQAKLN